MRKGRAYTIPTPVTVRYPVPASIVVLKHPDGGAVALAERRRLSRQRMHIELHRRFGDRASRPEAKGRRWVVQIHAPTGPCPDLVEGREDAAPAVEPASEDESEPEHEDRASSVSRGPARKPRKEIA